MAIDSGAKTVIVPNMGKPWNVEPLSLKSNQEIVFESGVVITALKDAFRGSGDALFQIINKENITVSGYGCIWEMRKNDYARAPYKKAQWRHTLSLHGCRNVKIFGLKLRKSGGDGIYIGKGSGENSLKYCEDIIIKDVIIDKHYRQGISIISAKNLLIENTIIANTSGTPPQAGIDFEPNGPDELFVSCRIKNCRIVHNSGPGLLIYLTKLDKDSRPVEIHVESTEIAGNSSAIWIDRIDAELKGEITFINNDIKGFRFVTHKPNCKILFE